MSAHIASTLLGFQTTSQMPSAFSCLSSYSLPHAHLPSLSSVDPTILATPSMHNYSFYFPSLGSSLPAPLLSCTVPNICDSTSCSVVIIDLISKTDL